jgi:hypothetical protein
MKSVLPFLIFPLLAGAVFAATAVQPVVEFTAQQAIIRYRTSLAPGTPCSHAITEAISGATPDDVNPAIFFGSNLDTRPGSIIDPVRRGLLDSGDRAFVFGQRTAAPGSDGLIHSRSAKANTAYTDTVTCGTDAPVTVPFTTDIVENGSTYVESPPWCSQGFGNYCWPSINWSNQSQQFADPQTGVVIQRVTSPGWWGVEVPPQPFDNWSGGAGWTNPGNILSSGAQTANSNKLFVAMNGANFQKSGLGDQSAGFATSDTYDDFLMLLSGSCSSSGANCVVNLCLTYWDSATCNTATQTVTIPGSTGTVGFPANSVGYSGGTNTWKAQFQFGEWGGTPPVRGDFASSSGTVNTSGTTVTLNPTYAQYSSVYFNTKWKAGALIHITGSGCISGGTDTCTLAAPPASQESLTVTETMNPLTNANYYSMASGVLIWKNNTSGSVTVGASYSYAFSAMYQLLAEGDALTCNPNSVTVSYAADGVTAIPPVPGNLCYVLWQNNSGRTVANGSLFLLIPSTGETRLLSPLATPAAVDSGDAPANQNTSSVKFGANAWDKTDPLSFYGTALVGTATSIFKATYIAADRFKAYSHPLWTCGTCGAGVPGQDSSVGYFARWSDDPLVYTNVTPPSPSNLDIYSQIAAKNPSYTPALFPSCGLQRIVQGYAFVDCSAGVQDSIGVINVFNLSTGRMTAWGDSYSVCPVCWGGIHTDFQSNVSPGYYALAINPPGGAGAFAPNPAYSGIGPHQITPYSMMKGGAFVTDTSMTLTAPLDACPSNAYNITGNMCVTVHTQDVCSHSPAAAEKAAFPCPYNPAYSQIQPLSAGAGLVITSNETLAILSSTPVTDSGCGMDCVELVLGRGQWGPQYGSFIGLQTAATAWTGYAIPPYMNCTFSAPIGVGCYPGIGNWTPANATGNLNLTWLSDPQAFGGHADAGAAPTPGNVSFVQASACGAYHVRYNLPLASQVGNFTNSNVINACTPFYGTAPVTTLQSYPSNEQYNASALNKRLFLDFHAMNGSGGFSGQDVRDALSNANVSYSLVSGTSTVYKFSTVAGSVPVTEPNLKTNGFGTYAGRYLFQDISGPASAISDSTPWKHCITLKANECIAGSSVGDVYAAVPNLPAIQTSCYTDWVTESLPCPMFPATNAAQLVQMDGSQSYASQEFGRRLTMGLTGWGRQYQFNTFIAESTGTWGMFKADWADGIRSEIFMALLPPYAPASSVPRNTFVKYPVGVPAYAAFAEVMFGYVENGNPQAYFCSSRQDACTTSGTPFVYPSIDTRTPTSCSSGCTINIPVIPGRVVYYSVGSSPDGLTWTYGTPQVGLVQ